MEDKRLCRWCGFELTGPKQQRVHSECKDAYSKAKQKERYRKDIEESRRKNRELWRKIRDRHLERRRKNGTSVKYYRDNLPKVMLKNARSRAKAQQVPFNLNLDDIVVPEFCPILGVKLEIGTRHGPSLDKINPEKGYVKGNIQVISAKANAMKSDATSEELKKFAEWVSSFLTKQEKQV